MSEIPPRPYVGCSDGNCVFGHPGGQHTNGGCKCLLDLPLERRRVVQRALRFSNAEAQVVEALERITFIGTDCAPAMDPESFYRYQLYEVMGIAARLLQTLRNDRPGEGGG